jgi:YVTN family beta-propeller protein
MRVLPRALPRLTPRLTVCAAVFAAITLAGCRTGAFPQYSAAYREYVYVANGGSNTVSVLDAVDVRPQTTITVGMHPDALIANHHRNEIYAASRGNNGNGSVAFIDAETNRVVATVPVRKSPAALAIGPKGEFLYAANAGSNNVSVISIAARARIGTVGAGEGPDSLVVSPDGNTLVVANGGSGSVTVMDLPAHGLPLLRSTFSGCPGANSVVILPDSSKAFIACTTGRQVMDLGLRTPPAKHVQSTEIREQDRVLALLDVGQTPVHLALKPDGGEVFATNLNGDTVSEIDAGTNEVEDSYLIGSAPSWAVVSADDSLLWVANHNSDTMAVYSIDDGRLVNTVHVGDGPGPSVFSADQHLLFAADTQSGDVSVIRTFNRNVHREAIYGTLFTLLPAGSAPDAIVDKAFRLPR